MQLPVMTLVHLPAHMRARVHTHTHTHTYTHSYAHQALAEYVGGRRQEKARAGGERAAAIYLINSTLLSACYTLLAPCART